MLTYETLISQAKIREMPANKLRGILREYIQILILKEISRSKSGKKIYFLGGTYLRLIHNLRRFSEDLDFNVFGMNKGEFEKLIRFVKTELQRFGINSESTFKYRNNLLTANMIFPDIEERYNVKSNYKHKGFIIKIETNSPSYKIETETEVLSGFGEVFPILCMKKECIFAEKIDALIKKNRGRHIYDVIFMLSAGFPVSKKVLLNNNITEPPDKVILDRINSFSSQELKKLAKNLQPFLFDEKDSELVADAPLVISSLLGKRKLEVV
ncbi:MAG: nucleotidyl transferase AbiEii/AbiGii toxin family protein [Armatimonadota bacterium]